MVNTTVTNASELKSAVDSAGPGDEVVARGGTYDMSGRWTITSQGDTGNPLVIRASEGETPHIRFAAGGQEKDDSGMQFRGPYVHFKRFEVSGSGWKGVNADGSAHDLLWEGLDVHDCNRWGVMVNDVANVTIRSCDSHDHFDEQNDGGNSDGFNYTGRATSGLVENCRSWNNGDDGFDFWVSTNHTVRNCWAWNNGHGANGDGNGFKLGGNNDGGGHRVERCIAYQNSYRGFDWNTAANTIELVHCTAWDHDINYRFNDGDHVLTNNISYQGSVYLDDSIQDSYNTWNQGITNPEFRSTDSSSSDFLQLSSDSPCIDAGTDVGLNYSGSDPDLGAYEYRQSRSEPSGSGLTSNHGYNKPAQGTSDWHIPLNENFSEMDADIPIVDSDGVKSEYEPNERSLYIAKDTGVLYVGDGSSWNKLGSLN